MSARTVNSSGLCRVHVSNPRRVRKKRQWPVLHLANSPGAELFAGSHVRPLDLWPRPLDSAACSPPPAHPPPWRAPCRSPAHDSGRAVSVERGPGGSLPGQREGRPLSGAGRTGRRPGQRCLPTQAGREASCWRLAARTGPHPAPASSPDLSPGPQNSGQLSSARPQGSAGRSLAPRCAWWLCPAGSSGARPPCVGDISESRDSSGCPRKEPYGVLSARRPGVRNAVLPATARHPRSSCTRPGPASGLGPRGRTGGSRRRVCRSGTLPAPPQPAPGRLPRRPPVSPGLGRTRAPSSPPAPSAPTSWLCGPLC